jgi:DNA-binding beta-propeller fold protein YncE
MNAVRYGLMAIGALALASCAGNGVGSPLPLSQTDAIVRSAPAATAASQQRQIFVTSAMPYFFDAYTLPLRGGEHPAIQETGVKEPVPVANDGRTLYVGSFDDGKIYSYDLPLGSGLTAKAGTAFSPGLGDLSGLAVAEGYLYVAGEGAGDHEVLAYALPLIAGERPSASVTGFSSLDFLNVATRNHTLYIASTTAGTVGAYHLPLQERARPEYTIETVPQDDGATGVAVDGNGEHLYVSLYEFGDIYDYRLPYRRGETPAILDVESETGGSPYGVAVGGNRLFVTAGSLLAYSLPLKPNSVPEATVPFAGGAAGISASP